MQRNPWERRDQKYEGSRLYRWLDDRLNLEDTFLGKAFPEDRYSSFLLGEVALFTFVILAITGTFLGLLYHPSVEKVKYTGNVAQFAGQKVPAAYASVLHITYDYPFGMFIRMMHHWAAYLFISAMGLHMLRIFFTGAYRNPREPNWLIGSTLLLTGLVEAFMGYALPYDNFSATATNIGFAMTGAVPVLGPILKNLVFGGDFPGDAAAVLPRMFFLHVFLVPAVIAGLIGAHLFLLIRQKHTEDPGASRASPEAPPKEDDSVVVGIPLVPNQAAITMIVFLLVAATLSFLAALFPVQNVIATGPTNTTTTPAGVGPDWYFMWVFGFLKLMPSKVFGISSRLIGGVILPTITILLLVGWPFIDRHVGQVHYTANPLKRPKQTAVGVGAISFIIMLSVAGMNSTVADLLNTTPGAINTWLIVLTVGIPILEGLIVYYTLSSSMEKGGRPAPAGAAQTAGSDDD